jgi:glycosyltransferase involved in cell wall biosynthesis
MDKKGGNLLSLSLFKALLKENDVRLYHAHALKRLGGTVATAARLRRKPLVVSLHGGVFDVPAAELEAMAQPMKGHFEWGRIFGAVFRSRQLLHDADLVICVGQNEYDAAKRRLPHDRISYLPNGVDSTRFAQGDGARFRARHGLPQDAFVILNISRIDAQKNQLALLNAFAYRAAAETSAHLVLIGPETQPAYAQRLRDRILELGLQNRVRLLPGLRHDDPSLLDAYQACDVFALPSIHEPFGIVVLEAWSAHRPVIASAVGGLKTLIRHGENGLLFENEADLTLHLERLQTDRAMRQNLATAGREEARARYDWRCIHDQLERLYRAGRTIPFEKAIQPSPAKPCAEHRSCLRHPSNIRWFVTPSRTMSAQPSRWLSDLLPFACSTSTLTRRSLAFGHSSGASSATASC